MKIVNVLLFHAASCLLACAFVRAQGTELHRDSRGEFERAEGRSIDRKGAPALEDRIASEPLESENGEVDEREMRSFAIAQPDWNAAVVRPLDELASAIAGGGDAANAAGSTALSETGPSFRRSSFAQALMRAVPAFMNGDRFDQASRRPSVTSADDPQATDVHWTARLGRLANFRMPTTKGRGRPDLAGPSLVPRILDKSHMEARPGFVRRWAVAASVAFGALAASPAMAFAAPTILHGTTPFVDMIGNAAILLAIASYFVFLARHPGVNSRSTPDRLREIMRTGSQSAREAAAGEILRRNKTAIRSAAAELRDVMNSTKNRPLGDWIAWNIPSAKG